MQIINVIVAAQTLVDLTLVGLLSAHPDGFILAFGYIDSLLQPLCVHFISLVDVKDESSQEGRLGATGQISARGIGDDFKTLKKRQQIFQNAGNELLMLGIEHAL